MPHALNYANHFDRVGHCIIVMMSTQRLSRRMHYAAVLLIAKTRLVSNLTTWVIGHGTKHFVVVHIADVCLPELWYRCYPFCRIGKKHWVNWHVIRLRETVGLIAHPHDRQQLT